MLRPAFFCLPFPPVDNLGQRGGASAPLRPGVGRAALSIFILFFQLLASPPRGADAIQQTPAGTDIVPLAVTDVPLTQYLRLNGYLDSTSPGNPTRGER